MSSTLTLLAAGGNKTIRFHAIDTAILVAYIVALFVIGTVVSKKASKNLDSYFLGGKTLPWWIVGTSHGASGFDVSGTMWFTTMIFMFGLKGAWLGLVWPVFDRIFRQVYLGAWIRRSNVLTGAEWMNTRFGTGIGGNLSYLSVVIYAVVATVLWLGYAYKGIGEFAGVFLPWDASIGSWQSADVYATIILVITTAYVVFGGWYSVILTDVFQAVLKTIAAVFIGAVAMIKVSPETLHRVVPEGWFSPLFGWQQTLDWSHLIRGVNEKISGDGLGVFGGVMLLWFVRGVFVSAAGPNPGYGIQHLLSTRSPREAALENWFMSIVQLFPRNLMMAGIAVLGLVYFGPQLNAMAGSGTVNLEQVLPYVIRDFVPPGLVGLLVAGLLAAFMGMFDSTLNAGAAYVVNDLYRRYWVKDASGTHYVRIGYITSVLLVIIAIAVGSRVQSIGMITNLITGLLYAGYVAPNVLKWHWWRFNSYGYFAGMVSGVLAALAFWAFGPTDPTKVRAFLIVAPTSLVVSVVATLLTPPEDDRILETFYLRVRPWGFWGPVYQKIVAKNPRIKSNEDFWLDMLNIVIGLFWMFGQIIAGISLVTKTWPWFIASALTVLVTSIVMKRTWMDRLGRTDGYTEDVDEANALVEVIAPPSAKPAGQGAAAHT